MECLFYLFWVVVVSEGKLWGHYDKIGFDRELQSAAWILAEVSGRAGLHFPNHLRPLFGWFVKASTTRLLPFFSTARIHCPFCPSLLWLSLHMLHPKFENLLPVVTLEIAIEPAGKGIVLSLSNGTV